MRDIGRVLERKQNILRNKRGTGGIVWENGDTNSSVRFLNVVIMSLGENKDWGFWDTVSKKYMWHKKVKSK